jgi:beta-glucosidase
MVGADQTLTVKITVANPHRHTAADVVQLYLRKETGLKAAQRELAGFERVELAAGETRVIEMTLTARQIASVREDGSRRFAPGSLRLWAGNGQPDARSRELGVVPAGTSVEMKV